LRGTAERSINARHFGDVVIMKIRHDFKS